VFQRCVAETGCIDIAIANAGVTEEYDYFEDRLDEQDELLEPAYGVIDVNFRSAVNFVKLAVSQMRKQKEAGHSAGGSILITSSATTYAPEHNLPVYSASTFAVGGS
jgi:NAD(P)-dependent dehydrogenase (short-subunit alcohol dehydrogenase family)